MNKLKKMKLKLSAMTIVLLLVGVVAVVGGVKAYQSYGDAPKVVVEGDYIEASMDNAPVEDNLGAIAGPDWYNYLKVHGRFQQGGYMGTDAPAISTSTSDTITATQVWTYSGLDYTPGTAAMTITLPASSTLSFISSPGDCIDWRFRNLDSDSATSTTFAAGAGIDLVEYTGGDVVIEGGNEARLTFCRELDDDVTVYVDEYIAAD